MSKRMVFLDSFLNVCITLFPRSFVLKIVDCLCVFLCKLFYRDMWVYTTQIVSDVLGIPHREAKIIAYKSFLNQYKFSLP